MGFYDAIRVGASGAADSAYTVDRSLRFNDDDSAKLNRTFGTNSSNTTKTLSFWMKRGNLGSYQTIFGTTSAGFIESRLQFTNTDELQFVDRDSSSGVTDVNKVTTRKFRDVGAWYHIVFALNSTDGTADDRVKIYVNGVRETSFSTSTNPSSSYSFSFYRSSVDNFIGANNASDFFDGYLTEINFVDGQALTPASFGETNAETGQWNPKNYVGSYGTNGFYLNFSDNSGTTATTLGKDSSGNGNNFTPNNFSVSAGAGNDSVTDTPTNNFCTLNPLDSSGNSPSNGNLQGGTAGTSGWRHTRSTFALPSTGKWYWEYKIPTSATDGSNGWITGIAYSNLGFTQDINSNSTGLYGRQTQGKYNNSSSSPVTNSHFTTVSDNDILQFAYDADGQKLYTGKNNTWELSADPSAGSNPNWTSVASGGFPMAGSYGSNRYVILNFGQQAFAYTPPTGYKKLNSANLPDPTILLPNKHFDTLLYTGNGGTQSITGLDFQPDWVWIKVRSHAGDNHHLYDAVRGAAKTLFSNTTGAEQSSDTDRLSSFISNGFTLGNNYRVNASGRTFASWNWDAGDTDGKTYTVKVVSDGGNKYRFDDFGTSAVTLDLAEGGTYIFDGADSSMASHPIKLSETSNGTHGGGSSYNTGVTYLLDGASVTESAYVSGYASATTRQLKIVVAASAPTLYYYCHYHSGMGGQVNTNSTLGSSNFDGSRQAITKVNTTSGFSIISWTGTGSAFTLGHGLGVAPKVYIVKARTGSSGCNWFVYHKEIGATHNLRLNNTSASGAASDLFNNTEPTSSVLSIGDSSCINENNGTYITYAFSEVAGYSKFGSFVGNGSNDGPFIFLGFSAALIIYKNASAGSTDWIMFDPKRIHDGENLDYLEPNTNDAEGYLAVDILSNGFKLTHETNSKFNGNGNTFIYLAFAESPFKNARAR